MNDNYKLTIKHGNTQIQTHCCTCVCAHTQTYTHTHTHTQTHMHAQTHSICFNKEINSTGQRLIINMKHQACIFFIVASFFGYSHFLNICLQIHEKRWVAEDFYLQLFPHRPSVFQYNPDLISDIILVMVGSQYGLSFWL